MLKIGFIGNFNVSYSTESERKWSFEKLGHTVIPFQENETTWDILVENLNNKKFDILFYSHTHGWEIDDLEDFFKECSLRKVPTVSVHLDRWAWLERVKDMGKEATWFTEHIFMADGSPEAVELYKKLKINWHYLKPAVVERDCYIAKPDLNKYPHEIVFVGSKGYHPEYQFRPQLIDFLHKTYGDRFGHYGNDGLGLVRGNDLNTVMITAKIVVGDSCFGGRPNYVSDRYYETRGRGGFLLHPKVEGVDYHGVGFYEHNSLEDLEKQIEYYLRNATTRETMRMKGYEWVKKHETYTDRAREILKVIYG